MIAEHDPPRSYSQWLDAFAYLQEHPLDVEMLDALIQGSYSGVPAPAFLERLSNTVSLLLTRHCRRFLRQMDEAFADGEPDYIPVLAARLRRNIDRCLFYRKLNFLELGFVRTLDQGFREQLDSFWNNLLRELGKSARESGSPELEDLVLELKRIHILN